MNKSIEKDTFKFCYRFRVVFDDLDAARIVHNSNYLKYFERGRIEYVRNLFDGLSEKIHRELINTAVVEHFIQYKNPAKFDDELSLFLKISEITTSSLRFEYILEKSVEEIPVAYGYTVVVNVGKNRFAAAPLSDEVRKQIVNFEGSKFIENKS